MKIFWKDDEVSSIKTNPRIDSKITNVLKNDILLSFHEFLETPFIVNDTVWFEYTDKQLKPRVTNKADHLSKNFQNGLKKFGWEIDHKLNNQEIDGFKVFQIPSVSGHRISDKNLRSILAKIPFDQNFLKSLTTLYSCNYNKSFFLAPSIFDHSFFDKTEGEANIRVGLEFETGNIASSFRALSKLNLLFAEDYIDIGIFVTSDTKEVSTRIWPSANRNGSLQELRQRLFLQEIRLPVLICGFIPDGWNDTVGYLEKEGRYIIYTDEIKEIELANGQRKKMMYSLSRNLYRELKDDET